MNIKEKYKLGAIHFSGQPNVQPDFIWSTYKDENPFVDEIKDRPLTFLAQFNCE